MKYYLAFTFPNITQGLLKAVTQITTFSGLLASKSFPLG